MIVRPDDATEFAVTLPRTEIAQLELDVGRSTRKAHFARVGLGLGAAVAALVAVASSEDAFLAAGEYGLYGAVAGAVVGQFWTMGRWKSVPLRTESTGLRLLPGARPRQSVGLAVTMAVP